MTLRIKKLATFLLVLLTPIFAFLACGSSMNVNMLRNGKGSVTLTISKENVQTFAPDKESFEAYFEKYVAAINAQSGAIEALNVQQYEEETDCYRVRLKTRLVNKINGLGKISYGDTQSFCTTNTNNIDDLRDGYDAFVIPSILRVYPDRESKTYQTYYTDPNTNLPTLLNHIQIEAKSVESGEIVKFNDFKNTLLSSDKDNILFFQLADLELVDEISFSLPGDVKYVSVITDTETYKRAKRSLAREVRSP